MLVMTSERSPVLFTVTTCAGLVVPTRCSPNETLAWERLQVPGTIPLPVNLTTCGLFSALSAIEVVPLMVSLSVGVKVTLMLHCPPAGRLTPQVFV
jgi:hypothetical protein